MFCKNARTKLAMQTHGDSPASLAITATASVPLVASRPVAAAAGRPIPTPSLGFSPQYAAAVAALKQNLLPPGADERMLMQLREQQKLLETQLGIVRQADPASQLLLQQAILKEQATQMHRFGGVGLPRRPLADQSLLATTLALQQSQARLMQMREVLKMRFQQQHGQQKRSPHNHRASAA